MVATIRRAVLSNGRRKPADVEGSPSVEACASVAVALGGGGPSTAFAGGELRSERHMWVGELTKLFGTPS